MDLAMEWSPMEKGHLGYFKGCFICGEHSQSFTTTLDGPGVCGEHLSFLWEKSLENRTGVRGDATRCPRCDRRATVLWLKDGCTQCVWEALLKQESIDRWIFVGGAPIGAGEILEIGAYIEAWNRIGCCRRCGSKKLRIRRISMEFPRARRPVFPLWEHTKGELVGREKMRRRQLRAFTEGLLVVTMECPQCGYQEMEYPGLGEELLNLQKILSRL